MTVAGSKQRCGEDSGIGAEEVVLGVDTHLEVHVAVALDGLGREAWESWPFRRPRRVTKASSVGRKDLATWVAPAWRARAATAPGWPAT